METAEPQAGVRPRSDLKDVIVTFGLASVLVAVFGLIARGVPFVHANLGAFVAGAFLLIPSHWAKLRGEDYADYGFTLAPIGKGLLLGFGTAVVVFPVFFGGFVFFYDIVCAADAPPLLAKLAPRGFCLRWAASEALDWPPIDWAFFKLFFAQLIVVAIPEELFFRGFLHKLLEKRFAPKRRILGGGIGVALLLSSALFAIGHVLTVSDPRRLVVFFPGLVFGWMRSATGSILAGVIFHTLANMFMDTMIKAFF